MKLGLVRISLVTVTLSLVLPKVAVRLSFLLANEF